MDQSEYLQVTQGPPRGGLYKCSQLSFHSHKRGGYPPILQREKTGSEELTDTAKFLLPGEESCFEHGTSYPLAVLFSPWRVASLLPEKQLRRRV